MNPIPKMIIEFESSKGFVFNLDIRYRTTINQTLKYFLRRINRPELILSNSNDYCFIYNEKILNFGLILLLKNILNVKKTLK